MVRNLTECLQRVDGLDAQITSLSSRIDALLLQTSQLQVTDDQFFTIIYLTFKNAFVNVFV